MIIRTTPDIQQMTRTTGQFQILYLKTIRPEPPIDQEISLSRTERFFRELWTARVDTSVSQNNDKFRMTVESPNEFRGAVVDGYLTGIDRSGKITGDLEVTFNFQTIRLRNGQTYDFAGNLQTVTDENGKTVKIDDEGVAKGDSQTKETIKRSAESALVWEH